MSVLFEQATYSSFTNSLSAIYMIYAPSYNNGAIEVGSSVSLPYNWCSDAQFDTPLCTYGSILTHYRQPDPLRPAALARTIDPDATKNKTNNHNTSFALSLSAATAARQQQRQTRLQHNSIFTKNYFVSAGLFLPPLTFPLLVAVSQSS
jgi:hypothetical protein